MVAVGHTILVIIYHLLKSDVRYHDLGENYFNQLKPEQYRRYLVTRLQALGYEVNLTPKESAA